MAASTLSLPQMTCLTFGKSLSCSRALSFLFSKPGIFAFLPHRVAVRYSYSKKVYCCCILFHVYKMS